MKPQDNWFVLDNDAFTSIRNAVAGAITQSEIMLRASCPRKWYYRYAMFLEKRGFLDFNLVYGSLMHELLEMLYNSLLAYGKPPSEIPISITPSMIAAQVKDALLKPADHAELELVAERVQIAFNAYRTHYYKKDAKLVIYQVEHMEELEWRGLRLAGRIDMVAKPSKRDGVFIWDFKTAGQLNALALDAWTFKFQFLFYCWMYWRITNDKPTGIMINGLQKCALRPKIVDRKTGRKESKEEYLFRVAGDMAVNRERYFFRQRIPLGNGVLERFEDEILGPHIDAFKALASANVYKSSILMQTVNALAFQMNTNQCHVYNSYCEYLSLCKDGQMALGEFDARNKKHNELE
jgi:hypothetical protein